MPELEAMIEQKLIEELVYGDSQWTYREDLKTEEDLWKNFKYILEQNNKDRLNGENLSDAEFEQVKNQLQFSSFYKAGEWLVGENGKVQVHVQRDTERLHLVVMNHEHIAGGSSVYEVINQYSALKSEDEKATPGRDRRFDVTLMITIIVTHDPEEALTLSDHVMIINKGNISQYGKPEEIVKTPENDFVQEFILRQLEIKKNNIYSLFSVPSTERVPGMMQEVLVS